MIPEQMSYQPIVCLLASFHSIIGLFCCSGGLSNLLYCCSVAEKLCTKKGEVRKVMLRIYGQIIHENPEMVVTDSVIFALLAEKGLGPKLHGVFTGGRVEEYISVSISVCQIR